MSAAHRRSTINRRTFLAAAALSAPAAVLSSGRSARAQTAELRIATAWPEASGAGRALTAWGTLLARRTNNMVRLRFLFASAMGTDQDVVRRLRLRQVEGAMLTPVGARSFNTPLAVLEAPGVCPTYATLDTVRQAMMASFGGARGQLASRRRTRGQRAGPRGVEHGLPHGPHGDGGLRLHRRGPG